MNQIHNPIVSIIIPHHNNYQILKGCIDSLNKIDYINHEIIIVDDSSNDNSIQKIKDEYNNLIIKKSSKRLGYAGACNLGSKISKGHYLLFLNNDTIHKPDFINHLINKINKNQKIVAVQPKIKNIHNKDCFDYAGASGGFIDYLVFPFARGRIFNSIEKDTGQYNNSIKVFWTSGTAFITKKNVFEQLGGFDDKLFAHMEEIDYCWKCYLAGYECWVEPKSVIYHYGGQTLPYDSSRKTYFNHRNSLILLLTNYSLGLSLYLLPIRLLFEIISSFNDFIKFKFKHFFAHYMAIIFIVFNVKFLLQRRKKINKIRIITDKEILDQKIIFNESIVKKYFIFRKVKFNDIMCAEEETRTLTP